MSADVDRQAVLDLVSGGDVGWTARGRAGTAYRVWLTEYEHRCLTPGERRALLGLLADGTVRLVSGWRHHRGVVELTSRPDS